MEESRAGEVIWSRYALMTDDVCGGGVVVGSVACAASVLHQRHWPASLGPTSDVISGSADAPALAGRSLVAAIIFAFCSHSSVSVDSPKPEV